MTALEAIEIYKNRAALYADESAETALFEKARAAREAVYGKSVYMRGLIEFTNYCKNDCLYCGIRRSNQNAVRYRLTDDEIMDCCDNGHSLGMRTFVLQGGEDPYYTDERLCAVVSRIADKFPDCAITLSVGERSRESYQSLYDAGARRYLLRHETASAPHYAKLHPRELSLANRLNCLEALRDIGYQVGCGFMVGSPYQTDGDIGEDLLFIERFMPEMVGIGPFIPHKDTPFGDMKIDKAAALNDTLTLIALIRLIVPNALIPATTALGTIHPRGREAGLSCGANVIMPNLTPIKVRAKYMLYNDKICVTDSADKCRKCLQRRVERAGYTVSEEIGDAAGFCFERNDNNV